MAPDPGPLVLIPRIDWVLWDEGTLLPQLPGGVCYLVLTEQSLAWRERGPIGWHGGPPRFAFPKEYHLIPLSAICSAEFTPGSGWRLHLDERQGHGAAIEVRSRQFEEWIQAFETMGLPVVRLEAEEPQNWLWDNWIVIAVAVTGILLIAINLLNEFLLGMRGPTFLLVSGAGAMIFLLLLGTWHMMREAEREEKRNRRRSK